LPSTLSRTLHKYQILSPPDTNNFPLNTEVFDIEKILLFQNTNVTSDQEVMLNDDRILYHAIRKRSQGDFHAYGLTTVKILSSGERVELKSIISSQMYSLLASKNNNSHQIIKQRRYCFRWEHQAFHISQWLEPVSVSGQWFANVQSESEPLLPPFLNTGPELSSTPTKGHEFTFYEMSRKLNTDILADISMLKSNN
jgi:hypothetical protein